MRAGLSFAPIGARKPLIQRQVSKRGYRLISVRLAFVPPHRQRRHHMDLGESKSFIEAYTGLHRDALHVHGALFLYLLAMALFRRSRTSRVPWLAVLALAVVNEIYDFKVRYPSSPTPPWPEAAKDLWNTMLWPTVILFVGRYTNLFRKRGRSDEI